MWPNHAVGRSRHASRHENASRRETTCTARPTRVPREARREDAVAAADDQALEAARDPRIGDASSSFRSAPCGPRAANRWQSTAVRPAELDHQPRVAGDEHEIAGLEAGAFEVLVERPPDGRSARPRVGEQVLEVDQMQTPTARPERRRASVDLHCRHGARSSRRELTHCADARRPPGASRLGGRRRANAAGRLPIPHTDEPGIGQAGHVPDVPSSSVSRPSSTSSCARCVTSLATGSTPSSRASAPTTPGSRSCRSRGRADSRSIDPLAVDVAPLGEVLGGPGHDGRPRRRPGPHDPRARVRRAARAPLRHADRRRLPRLRHPVARVAVRADPRRAPRQGRPAHRLDPPPAHRRSAHVRGVRRRAPRRDLRRAASNGSTRAGPARVGARRVRGTAAARARPARSPRPRGGASRAAASCAARRAASRRRSPCGENARPSAPTSRRASCSPTSRSPASSPARRAAAKTSRRYAGSTAATYATAAPTRSSRRSRPGLALHDRRAPCFPRATRPIARSRPR